MGMAAQGSGRTGEASRCGLGSPGKGALITTSVGGVRYRTSKERCVADRVESTRMEISREIKCSWPAGKSGTRKSWLHLNYCYVALWFEFSAIV